ncbi:uncharacterized protein LOC134254598 [Saccostrea cucullata]|uniref:uncharacterized protein LOC134254598 n=1 Tax=Saccostrea cuccullata TaxID=36930 RepID=UPI002ED07B6F
MRRAKTSIPARRNRPPDPPRRQKSAMTSWMDDDNLSLSFNSNAAQTTRSKDHDGPTLDQVLKTVLTQQRQDILNKRQEVFGTARYVAERMLLLTNSLHSLFRRYIRTTKSGKVDILDFRAIDPCVFQCCVALKRPVRPQTFMFRHKRPREYPSHRMLLCINDTIPKVERIQVQHEWGHCVDRHGVIRPDFVLRWFNKGLEMAREAVMSEIVYMFDQPGPVTFDLCSYTSPKDGTLWLEVAELFDATPTKEFRINFIPCVPLQEIPKQLSLPIPIPNRRPYGETNSEMRCTINKAIDRGVELFLLEARMFKWDLKTKFDPSIAVSWQVGSGPLEDRAYKIISGMNTGAHFDNIILIIGKMKRENQEAFISISYRMIIHAILHVHRRCMGYIHKCEEWLLAVLEFLLSELRNRSAPSFFLNKLDLLHDHDRKTLEKTEKALRIIIRDLRSNPEALYRIVKYEEPKSEDEEEEEDEVSEAEDDEEDDNEEDDDEFPESSDGKRSFEEDCQFESDTYITDVNRADDSLESESDDRSWIPNDSHDDSNLVTSDTLSKEGEIAVAYEDSDTSEPYNDEDVSKRRG